MQEIGEEKYQKFVAKRIEDECFIRDTINTEELLKFTNNNKSTSVKVNAETL